MTRSSAIAEERPPGDDSGEPDREDRRGDGELPAGQRPRTPAAARRSDCRGSHTRRGSRPRARLGRLAVFQATLRKVQHAAAEIQQDHAGTFVVVTAAGNDVVPLTGVDAAWQDDGMRLNARLAARGSAGSVHETDCSRDENGMLNQRGSTYESSDGQEAGARGIHAWDKDGAR